MKKALFLQGLLISALALGQLKQIDTGLASNYGTCDNLLAESEIKSTKYDLVNRIIRDSLGWFIIDADRYGDGVTNATEHIQSVIDAAGNGNVYFPPGAYVIDSVNIGYSTGSYKSPNLYGAGSVSYSNGATTVIANSNKPPFNLDVAIGYPEGGIIDGFYIKGSDKSSFANQHGIWISGAANYTIRNCYIYQMGGWGIKFDTDIDHTHNYTVYNVKFQENHLGGIYGVGTSTAYQLNAITIRDCHFIKNSGYGAWLWGININFENNIVEQNDNAGVYISSAGVSSGNSASQMSIQKNYLEYNRGGDILVETGYVNGNYHVIYELTIKDNYIYNSDSHINKPGILASITCALESGSSATKYLRGITIGPNRISNKGKLARVDGNDLLDKYSRVFTSYNSAVRTNYINLGSATVNWQGVDQTGWTKIPTIKARKGITTEMLSPAMYCQQSSAVDITANPQIVEGLFDGQELMIMGNSDIYTLSFDDGDGLSLGGKRILGAKDVLKLKWFSAGSTWEEIGFSDK